MKSLGNSQTSNRTLTVAFVLSLLVSIWAWWVYRQGFLLYYGDAQAHLNNSRSILDSRTPGYDQLGTVWLPVLHVICLPFVRITALWSSGLAGTIPVAFCFVVAGVFFYLSAYNIYGSRTVAAVVLACFALNPNVLYLAVIPMTEIVFLAGIAVLVYSVSCFQTEPKSRFVILGALASLWMSLTRYDGWFLIPFAAAWFFLSGRRHRWQTFLLFGAIAGLAPVYWLGHSWYETGNALDFFNGPYSAKAIQHGAPYPGFHDWPNALLYYAKAGQLCTGWGLLLLGAIGLCLARTSKARQALCFLLLPCLFYVWSIHSSGNPIHVPQLWPFSYYNTRYGIAMAAFCAFAAGAVAVALESRHKRVAFVLPLVALAPWLIHPSRQNWICWKESEVNSISRRAWTAETAAFLRDNYRPGQGILAPFGDVTGIFCRAKIPLTEVLHEGNGPAWLAATARLDLVHTQTWAIAQAGDYLDRSLKLRSGSPYISVYKIQVPGAPAITVYRRK